MTAPTTVPRGRPGPTPWFQTRSTAVGVSGGGRRRGLCGPSCRVSLQSFTSALGQGGVGGGWKQPPSGIVDRLPATPSFPRPDMLSHHCPANHPGWDPYSGCVQRLRLGLPESCYKHLPEARSSLRSGHCSLPIARECSGFLALGQTPHSGVSLCSRREERRTARAKAVDPWADPELARATSQRL